MKTNMFNSIADRPSLEKHRVKDRFMAQPHFPRTSSFNHGNENRGKTAVRSEHDGRENAPISSLWVSKIGGRIVGMARLIQNGPHSARIVLFRIDPEWSHTHVPLNLIRSIQSFCENHGRLNVIMQPHTVPFWLLTLMNQNGFQCV